MVAVTGGSSKGDLPALDGSIGEQTAVASAKRAVLGDFNEGGFVDDALEESLRGGDGRAVIVTCLGRGFSGLSDIASEYRSFEA